MELDTSGFATQGPTVFAGNIGDNKYIIQVSPMGIRLLEGGKKKNKIRTSVIVWVGHWFLLLANMKVKE